MKLFVLFSFVLVLFVGSASAGGVLHVFSAASLTDLLSNLSFKFEKKFQIKVHNVFASSSVLARQIKEGAPANIFISANQAWMDDLELGGFLREGSRYNLLKNNLVLITQREHRFYFSWKKIELLSSILKNNRIAIGDPSHVPAGIYAKTSFKKMGVWDDINSHVIRARNVRLARTYVENGEALIGVVYKSDILGRDKIKLVSQFPIDSHPPILYPIAIIKNKSTNLEKKFLEFLRLKVTRDTIKQFGFMIPLSD